MTYIPVKYEPIKCQQCDEVFEPNRRDKRFCSRACYRKWGKKNLGHSQGHPETIRRKNKIRSKRYKNRYKRHKKSTCEECGFIPIHPCQLDVDHINGDHKDNRVQNLQTLCANCHRLKTYINKDWIKEKPPED